MSFTDDVRKCFEQHKALREALEVLVERVELCGKESAGIFQIAAIHGCPYNGPNWVEELRAAKNVLAKYSNILGDLNMVGPSNAGDDSLPGYDKPKVIFTCLKCEQNYTVPEKTNECPVCGHKIIVGAERGMTTSVTIKNNGKHRVNVNEVEPISPRSEDKEQTVQTHTLAIGEEVTLNIWGADHYLCILETDE